MTATAETLVDLGACGWCSDGQWDHRQGKKGCKIPGCGCGKYEPPKAAPAVDPGLAAALAEPEPVDEPVPDAAAVVADPAAHAEHAVQVAAIDAQLADPEPTDVQVADEIDRAEDAAQIERLTAELEQVRADKIRLAGKLNDARDENRRLREALTRAEGHHATALEALRKTGDAYVQTSIAAATRVLYRYDADQCTTEGCGSRYTVPVEHEHPLTPVTVLVVRREVPGAA